MLKSLYIENIAVIEKTAVDLGAYFNVLTGETGAGKSIIIDAINAVLGERTSKELIRAGCKNAVVTAVFSSVSGAACSALSENGFTADENGDYTIQRILSNTSSTIKINGQPVSANTLRSFAGLLINIHGQHDNQALLQPENHYKYLDMLAENADIISNYLAEFNNFNSVRSALKKLDIDEDEKLRKIDLLKYQIDELKGANITVGEVNRLKENLEVAKNAEKHKNKLSEIVYILNGDDTNDGVLASINEISRILSKQDINKLNECKLPLDNSYDTLFALKNTVEECIEDLNSSLYNAEEIGDRLSLLSALMRKYGDTEEKMLEFLDNAEKELKQIEFNDDEIFRLEKELELSQNRLIKLAEKLTASRKTAAQSFEKQVADVLKELNMPNVKLHTQIEQGRYTRTGCDEIQFLLSANAGEDVKPLSKIASGGELSRIMLAIKSVLSEKDDVDTLIFDEIDTGISGLAADKVGIQLKRVANNRQVICVTHLAQIAACANNHYLIEKSVNDGRTYTKVMLLKDDARINEIARIMGGSNVTEALLSSAKEMLINKISII